MTNHPRPPSRLARICMAASALALLLSSAPAFAYLGPGIAAGAVLLVIALVGSVVLALAALFWYPLKRLWRRRRHPTSTAEHSQQ